MPSSEVATHPTRKELLALYSEAWRQYVHEDSLGHSRNSFFASVHAGLIGILTTAAVLVAVITPDGAGPNAVGVMGVFICVLSAAGLSLVGTWSVVVRKSKSYVDLRWATVLAIEQRLGVEKIAPASVENCWQKASKASSEKFVKLFSGDPEVSWIEVPRKRAGSGFMGSRTMMQVFSCIWTLFFLIGGYVLIHEGVFSSVIGAIH